MTISVHAISMLYELRALRSRLQSMLAQQADSMICTPEDLRNIEWSLSITEMLIHKTERTGEYIANLQAGYDPLQAAEKAADLGSDRLD